MRRASARILLALGLGALAVLPLPAGGPVCGNGVVETGETCDPPDPGSPAPDRCRSDCTFCGDGGFDSAFEACDDGANVDGDGCEADCHVVLHVALDGSDATGDGSAGNPFRTIQHAFDQATSFTRILVGPGTYNECVVAAPPRAADRPVQLVAEAWATGGDNTATVVSGLGVCDASQPLAGRAPTIEIASRGSRVEGFTITRGGASGILGAGSVAITNNLITDNDATRGAGIRLDLTTTGFGALTAEISDNVVQDNQATEGDGGGILVNAVGIGYDVDVTIDDNEILDNTATGVSTTVHGAGLGVTTNSSAGAAVRVAITNNVITGNVVSGTADGYGGGMWLDTFGFGTETIDVTRNTFTDNRATAFGGGISANISTAGTRGDNDPGTPDSVIRHTINIADNVFTGNRATNGAGMDLFAFAQNLEDTERIQINATRNVLTGNMSLGTALAYSGGGGGALATFNSWRSATPDSWIRLEDNVLQSNTAEISGAGLSLVAEADANPPGDTTEPRPPSAFAAARIDAVGNLIAGNDASADFAGGGGVFAYVKAFVDAQAEVTIDRSTIADNLADFGAGGVHVETFTADDDPPTGGSFEALLTLSNSIVAGNDGVGVGGPIPGVDFGILAPDSGNTGDITLSVAYSDVFGHPGGNYDVWFNNPSGQNGNIVADPLLDARYGVEPCSPTIDAADPALDFAAEPLPNGDRANMGHTGGTAQAAIGLADLGGDGVIDGLDILTLSVAFGAAAGEPRYDAVADVNGDGVVDGADLSVVAADFGVGCP